MKRREVELFPASVVGSLPRPKFVQEMVFGGVNLFSEAMDRAVLFALTLQEKAGLDVVTDGEWRRKSYLAPIAEVCGGFHHEFLNGISWHTLVSRLEYVFPGFAAREVRFLKRHTTRKVKVCLPSPYLLGQRMWDPKVSARVYPTRREFMEALVPILRRETELAFAAGADIVQIDDPHICLFVDKELRKTFQRPDEELRFACSLVNEVVKGIKVTRTEKALHLCRRNKGRRGWVGKGGYEAIISEISAIEVDQFVMEYSIPVAGDFSALTALPERFRIGLGCVDCRFACVDSPEEIVTRVEAALKYIAPERIVLNPDCGFAPGAQAEIPLDEVYLKLKHEAQAARILRNRWEAR